MKSFAKLISAIALASASVSALAYPIATPIQTLNLDVASNAPASFSFDLTNSDPSYIAGASTLDSAVLHLTLSDPLGGNEKYSVFFGSAVTAAYSSQNVVNNGNIVSFDVILDALARQDLMADGKILVTFKAALQGGDDGIANYRVDSATLSANAVPEPATLSLMGLALAGLGVSRRRKQK
jgi:hypothetical protein